MLTKYCFIGSPHLSYFFTASGSVVKIHSRVTGEVVSTLAPPPLLSQDEASTSSNRSPSASLTGLLLHPRNPLQLLTSSLDGTVRIWDFLDAVLIKTIDVAFPITQLACHASVEDHVFVAIRKPKATQSGKKKDPFDFTGRSNSIIYSMSLALSTATIAKLSQITGEGVYGRPKAFLRIGKTREAADLQVSPDGNWLVAIGNHKVQIANTKLLRDGFTKFVSDERLISLAFHPSESSFATGDVTGKIRIWHCLEQSYLESSREAGAEKQAPSILLHWHSHAVSSLCYLPNGAYLLSGGEEAVLVLWQLSTKQREYVPRLGAPIVSIAVGDGFDGREQEFALGLADGSVTFVGALNLKPARTFARVKVDFTRRLLQPTRLLTLPSPLAVEPVTGQLVFCAGHPSSLQFVDLHGDQILSELEVAPSNRISRPDDAPLEPTRIEQVVFSSRSAGERDSHAEWMVTVDSRQGGGSLSNEVALKFWRWGESEGRYILNTRVDKPHDDNNCVSSMAFRPVISHSDADELLFVTTSHDDKKIKIWHLEAHRSRDDRLETYWVPRSIFGYRDCRPEGIQWSPDGSLLAVAQGPFVTIWEPLSNSLLAALSCPELRAATKLKFLGRAGRYMAVASSKGLVVWDLVRSSVQWHKVYDESIHSIIASGAGSHVIVLRHMTNTGIQKKQTIMDIVDVASGAVDFQRRLPFAARTIVDTPWPQSMDPEPHFVAIDERFDIHRVGSIAEGSMAGSLQPGGAAQSLRSMTVKRRTLFDDLLGPGGSSATNQGPEASVAGSQPQATPNDVFALFDAPAHLLPPVQMLFESYVAIVLPPRGSSNGFQDDTIEDDRHLVNRTERDSDGGVAAEGAVVTFHPRLSTVKSKSAEDEEMRQLTQLFAEQLKAKQD